MKISNSQIMSLQVCEMRFYYEHNDTLRPKEYPDNVRRGIFGHSLFEEFFKAYKEGKDYEACVEAMNPVLLEGMNDAILLTAYRLVLAFGAYAFTQPWKIIEVEENRSHQIAEDEFVYTPDLVIEWTSGVKKGTRAILDFKFTGQYWNDNEINTFQQLPKYMLYYNKHVERENRVTNCAVVMLNTRAPQGATGEKLFLIKWIPVNKKKLARIEHENEVMMQRVKHVKETYKPGDYMRTVSTFTCKMCFFAKPCGMELAGQDTTRILKLLFVHNDYFSDNYGDEDDS